MLQLPVNLCWVNHGVIKSSVSLCHKKVIQGQVCDALFFKAHIDRHAPQRTSPLRENNLPLLPVQPPPRHPISRFQGVTPRHFRDWSLMTGRAVHCLLWEKVHRATPPHHQRPDPYARQLWMPFSPPSSEIKQEVCKLLTLISQGIDWYKVLVVGKNCKLNDTIKASALWSNIPLEIVFALTTQCKWKWHKQHEMYLANVRPNAKRPNAPYIPPARVGGLHWG